jgi:peptidoglycan hydrolase-like protein with peptidoglycan-binding domain
MPILARQTIAAAATVDSYWWAIHLPVRYAYKEGMAGSDIAALQLNLMRLGYDLTVDGYFGADTDREVRQYQIDEFGSGADDGVAGAKTLQRICVQRILKATQELGLPQGFLKSLVSSECSFIFGAVSAHPLDDGWDIGAFQLSSGAASTPPQDLFVRAYDIGRAAFTSGRNAVEVHDSFPTPVASGYLSELANGDKEKFKWQMVALNHNWPAAAYWIPRRGHIYIDPARDDQWTQWIYDFTFGKLTTPRQWVEHQVESKTVYLDL